MSKGMSMQTRVAICTNFISPYRRPVFRKLAEMTGWRLRVVTNIGMEHDRDWCADDFADEPFEVRQCRSFARRQRGGTGISSVRHFPVGLPAELLRFKPDAIITGELGPRTALASVTGYAMGAKVIPWTYRADPSPHVFPLGPLRGLMVRHSSAVIGMGDRARHTLEAMDCDPEQIHDAPNAADIQTIQARLRHESHCSAVRTIKDRFQGRRLAVVVGRMISAKSIRLLVDAWIQLPADVRVDWALAFIGDGPERARAEGRHRDGIHCIGSLATEQVIDWMSAADLHIFGSVADPWGLVVNEAMHCGTPTLCSVRAGCFEDLILDGHNGFAFNPQRGLSHTSEAMSRAMTHPGLASLGSRARAHAAQFTPTRMARGMANAVTAALLTKPGTLQEIRA